MMYRASLKGVIGILTHCIFPYKLPYVYALFLPFYLGIAMCFFSGRPVQRTIILYVRFFSPCPQFQRMNRSCLLCTTISVGERGGGRNLGNFSPFHSESVDQKSIHQSRMAPLLFFAPEEKENGVRKRLGRLSLWQRRKESRKKLLTDSQEKLPTSR